MLLENVESRKTSVAGWLAFRHHQGHRHRYEAQAGGHCPDLRCPAIHPELAVLDTALTPSLHKACYG